MGFIPLTAGESELGIAIGYLFGAGVVLISMFLAVGGVLSHRTHSNSNLISEGYFRQGKAGLIHQQGFFGFINSLLHGRNIQRGSLLFVALGILTVVSVLLLALAMSCLCLASTGSMEYVFITLAVVATLITCLTLH